MKFGADQLLEHTPINLAKFGHSLIACSTALSAGLVSGGYAKLALASQIAGAIGYFLTNMFGEETQVRAQHLDKIDTSR
jgi:hypothetical protein